MKDSHYGAVYESGLNMKPTAGWLLFALPLNPTKSGLSKQDTPILASTRTTSNGMFLLVSLAKQPKKGTFHTKHRRSPP